MSVRSDLRVASVCEKGLSGTLSCVLLNLLTRLTVEIKSHSGMAS